ncbi:hypothetical protein OC861_002936 [Tilletia horrida]|nr:hypothetical protein OC861_002936 [Tilletia horrida]
MSFHRVEEEPEGGPGRGLAPLPIPIIPSSVHAPSTAIHSSAEPPKLPPLAGFPAGPSRSVAEQNQLPSRISRIDSPFHSATQPAVAATAKPPSIAESRRSEAKSARLESRLGRLSPKKRDAARPSSRAGSVLATAPAVQVTQAPKPASSTKPVVVTSSSKEFNVHEDSPSSDGGNSQPRTAPPAASVRTITPVSAPKSVKSAPAAQNPVVAAASTPVVAKAAPSAKGSVASGPTSKSAARPPSAEGKATTVAPTQQRPPSQQSTNTRPPTVIMKPPIIPFSAASPTSGSAQPSVSASKPKPPPATLARGIHLESVAPGSVRNMQIEEMSPRNTPSPRSFHVNESSENLSPMVPRLTVQPPTEASTPAASRRASLTMGNLNNLRGPSSHTGSSQPSLASRIRSYIAGAPLPVLPEVKAPKQNVAPDTTPSPVPPQLPPTVAEDGNELPLPPPDPATNPLDRLASIRIPYVPATAHRPPLEPIPPLPEFLRGEASEPRSMRDLPGYDDIGVNLNNSQWRSSPRGPGSQEENQQGSRTSLGADADDIALTGHRLTDANYEETRIHVQGGRLSFEVALPPSLMNELQHPQYFHAPESTWPHFESVRYSAVTCDPDELRERGYILRQTPVYNSRHVNNGRGSVGIATSNEGYSAYAWVGNNDIWENGWAVADGPGMAGDRPRIEICICVTLYNERADAFVRTMDSIFRNIYFLATRRQRRNSANNQLRNAFEGPSRTNSKASTRTTGGKYRRMNSSDPEGEGWTFGSNTRKGTAERGWFYDNSWLKIVLVIVLDGPADPRVLDNLEAMGLYQPSCLWETGEDGKPRVRKTVMGDEIRAHLFEHTISVPSPDWAAREQGEPRSTVLLDVGTRPFDNAFWHLWRPIYLDPDIAGTCGEIRTSLGRGNQDLANPLVAAQNFEYKTSNILDKPLETVLGFVSVLPGAFSCYRFAALLNDGATGQGPLATYLAGEFGERQKNLSEMSMVYRPMVNDVEAAKNEARARVNNQPDGLVVRNSYLAEDRILCWELVSKKGERNKLLYNRRAVAETDPVLELPEMILQRRRWLNGSFFTSWHAVLSFGQVYRTRHHVWLFNLFNLWFAWLQPANFFISFFYISDAFVQQINRKHGFEGGDSGNYPGIYIPVVFMTWLYVGVTGAVTVLSLGNKPNGVASQWFFRLAALFYAILVLWIMAATGYLIYCTVTEIRMRPGGWDWHNVFVDCSTSKLWIAALSTYGLWFISASILYSFVYLNSVNIFNIFAFCNTNTFTWGTKGITEEKNSKDFRATRSDPREDDELPVSIPQLDRLEASYRSCMARITQSEFLSDKLERQLDRRLETGEAREARERERTLDYYSSFRTALVLGWLGTNIVLAVIILSLEQGRNLWTGAISRQPASICEQRGSTYMNFLLYSIAAIAAVKFIGLLIYLTVLESMY